MSTIKRRELGMTRIKEILKQKGHEVWSLGPQATVFEALEIMAEKGIGAVPVVEGDRVVGIFSERDYARKVILQGRSSRECLVKDLMTSRVRCVGLEANLETCMALMTRERVRHLPVLDDENLVGIVSIGDIVKGLLGEREVMIQDLETYIAGGAYR